MSNSNFDADDATLSVDLSEARQAVKESRFKDALSLLEILTIWSVNSKDKFIKLWDCDTYELITILGIHNGEIWGL